MSGDGKRVGVIGLGAMGTPMAEQILRKHGQLTVFDVDPAPVQKLVAGAKAARQLK
jgi:3-hydroxyisobutyrate dehydrogenase-like beta-hydroxyacid dehydrogenase